MFKWRSVTARGSSFALAPLSLVAAGLLVPALVAGCNNDDAADVAAVEAPTNALTSASPIYPTGNPLSPAKVELGRLLFWDPVLSGDRDVACASCHHPDYAYTDGRPVSVGTGGSGLGPTRAVGTPPHRATRNAMTILNVVWNGRTTGSLPNPESAPMFWDNREHSLENQAKGPTTAINEMLGSSFDATSIFPEVVKRLEAIPDYTDRFASAFAGQAISEDTIVKAIATFERSLVDQNSSYDRYVRGDGTALNAQEVRGLETFARSGCSGCHTGPMFSDFATHRIAARRGGVARSTDNGAGGGTFRTASLRNVARTAPYMHDGAFADLNQVFDLYRNVDDGDDPKLRQLRVPNGDDRDDVIAFLQSISDGDFDKTIPAQVPSGLAVGGNIEP